MSAKTVSRLLAVAFALASTAAIGSGQRSFVASTGNDSHPCSLAQPCRSFVAAIAQTLSGGEVVVVDSAGYGIVTVTKSVSIVVPPGVFAGISVTGSQTGITVNGAGIVVVLRGLSINGVGGTAGIEFVQGSRLRVESCVIANINGAGIVQQAPLSELTVVDTIVRDNGGGGVVAFADASMLLDNVRIEHNGADGVHFAGGGGNANATIRNSVVSYNGSHGVAAPMPAPGHTKIVVESSVVSNNASDGLLAGGSSGTGQVVGTVRRSIISNNGQSGIYAFNGPSGGQASIQVNDNTFAANGYYAIRVDGYPSETHMSGNSFDWFASTFWTGPQGYQATYGDNVGGSSTFGPAPALFQKF